MKQCIRSVIIFLFFLFVPHIFPSVVHGKTQSFTQSKANDVLTLKIGDANRLITGVHTYSISYRVSGAISYFSDHDELYWNMTGNAWTVPIEKAEGSIVLPASVAAGSVNTHCFTGITGSTIKNCHILYDNGSVTSETTAALSENEGLTDVVGFPKNIVAVMEPKKIDTRMQTIMTTIGEILVGLGLCVWYILLPIWIIVHWFKVGRDPKSTVGQAHVWFAAPKLPNGRTLTPGETGTLVDETVDFRDITATIIDLARRGFFTINEKKKNDFYLEKKIGVKKGKDLQSYEQKFLDDVFASDTSIRIKDTDFTAIVSHIKTGLYEGMVTDGFFMKRPDMTRTIYYIIAGFAVCTFNFPLAIIAFLFGRAMPKKTQLGVDCAVVARALKGFIVSQDREFAFQAKKQLLFEQMLPFAVCFGVEKIWAARFKDIAITRPTWYTSYNNNTFSTIYFAGMLHSSFLPSVVQSATPTRSSSGFSSGFGGGGFSGGGGGGGGGGSW